MHNSESLPGSAPAAPAPSALTTVWIVVNLVNILQAAGFASRVIDPDINRFLGIAIIALGIPAGIALVSFVSSGSGWRFYAGPVCFLMFVVTELAVDYLWQLEFRAPRRPEILIPYLVLFFGSIVLMGAPMFRINRRRWTVTATTSMVLLGATAFAMVEGVG